VDKSEFIDKLKEETAVPVSSNSCDDGDEIGSFLA
jgi:hypothetical protein